MVRRVSGNGTITDVVVRGGTLTLLEADMKREPEHVGVDTARRFDRGLISVNEARKALAPSKPWAPDTAVLDNVLAMLAAIPIVYAAVRAVLAAFLGG